MILKLCMLDEFSSNKVWLMTRKIEILEKNLDEVSRICQYEFNLSLKN